MAHWELQPLKVQETEQLAWLQNLVGKLWQDSENWKKFTSILTLEDLQHNAIWLDSLFGEGTSAYLIAYVRERILEWYEYWSKLIPEEERLADHYDKTKASGNIKHAIADLLKPGEYWGLNVLGYQIGESIIIHQKIDTFWQAQALIQEQLVTIANAYEGNDLLLEGWDELDLGISLILMATAYDDSVEVASDLPTCSFINKNVKNVLWYQLSSGLTTAEEVVNSIPWSEIKEKSIEIADESNELIRERKIRHLKHSVHRVVGSLIRLNQISLSGVLEALPLSLTLKRTNIGNTELDGWALCFTPEGEELLNYELENSDMIFDDGCPFRGKNNLIDLVVYGVLDRMFRDICLE